MRSTYGAVVSTLASSALAISDDGMWTGHDWIDNYNGIENTNGILSPLTDLTARRMRSASMYMGDDIESIYLSMPNVQMVQSVLSED